MRCLCCCTASSYDTQRLYTILSSRFPAFSHRNVLHIEIPSENKKSHVFYFPYGSIVCWGLSEEQEKQVFSELKAYETGPLEFPETDVFSYTLGESPKVLKDEIFLPDGEMLTLLAVSHGLAQSVKLAAFETAIQKTFNSTKHIPADLAKWGKIPLSRSEIRRKMGELFMERTSVNLHFDILDTPEFFWEHSELEYLYIMISNYLDIGSRVEVLNQRLDVVHELFNVLGNELNHQHSSRLEWTIIWLILIEVGLTLLRDVFQWI